MAAELNADSLDFTTIIRATNTHQGTTYTHLKDKQQEALSSCAAGDAICVLPTGFGKTVVIQMLPFLEPQGPPNSVVVATPLNAIIEEQKQRFGTSCIVVDDQLLKDLDNNVEGGAAECVRTGKFQFLLGHPEKLLDPMFRRILMTPSVSSKITHIVIDEVHCVLSWGKSQFRPAFLQLHHLRASLPQAKLVGLTATATPKAIQEITKSLTMRQPTVVKASPDRPSVYIQVKRRPPNSGGDYTVLDSYMACVDPLLIELKEKQGCFPRTIMYMPLKWCGYSHERALGVLKDCPTFQAVQKEGDDEVKSFIAQYHAPQTAEMKQLISKSMLLPENPLRLLFATEAYGMGADSPNVRRIVHAGPPSNLETYIQEIGRCGRDGCPADAILYFNNSDLGANKKHVTNAMRDFCRLTTCRRKFLMEYFGCSLEQADVARCCDVCSGTPPEDERPVQRCQPIPYISLTLQDYFEAENSLEIGNCIPAISTGLDEDLADLISSQADKYLEGDTMADEFTFLLPSYIENIKAILAALIC